jgi:hypothetical protein
MLLASYFSKSLGIHSVSFPTWLWLSFLVYNFAYISIAAACDSFKRINKAKAILSLLLFNYSYVPLFVWAFLTAKNKTWVRTDHTRNLSFDDLSFAEQSVAATSESID